MKRKICVFTGTRAEYGLLRPLLDVVRDDGDLVLQIIASGMHLSEEFGLTYREIEADGFAIDAKVEMLLGSDTPCAISKSTGLGIIGLCEAYERLAPDIVVLLGDRFEVLAAATAAMFMRIPIAHIHGGESTHGSIDEAIRHAVTKMSHLHFTSTGTYRKRVIQLGETPERVFNTGAIGLDNLKRLRLLSRRQLEDSLDIRFARRNLLVTYHPVTLEKDSPAESFGSLLEALGELENTFVIFTKANADTGGRIINRMIDEYATATPHSTAVFASLGQLRYLSAMKHVDAVVGNSSSGIIEAPSLGTATINIGDRQAGRIRADSVIDCAATREDIARAFSRLWSNEFRAITAAVANPYDQGGAAEKIAEILKTFDLGGIIRKQFHDVAFEPGRSA